MEKNLVILHGITWRWKLNILNLSQGVSVSPPNEAISIDFRPTKLQPDILRHTSVARITFNGKDLTPRISMVLQ